jgi:uncharacterized membrane protein
MHAPASQDPPPDRSPYASHRERRNCGTLSALLIGFSVAGLFDGIFLHQILQWHHLLSAVQRPWLADLRAQVVVDGVFHAVMWLILMVGLILAVRAYSRGERHAAATMYARALFGFATWHVIDALLDHWVLRIHHIRDAAANPFAWDLGWLALFGVLPAITGIFILRCEGGGPGGPNGKWSATVATAHGGVSDSAGENVPRSLSWLAWTSVGLSAFVIAQPGLRDDKALLVALPGTSVRGVLNEVQRLDARVLWADRSSAVWAVSLPRERSDTGVFSSQIVVMQHGVILLQGGMFSGGCNL